MGMLFLETNATIRARSGRVEISTIARAASINRVMAIPPNRRMGARTPSRCIRAII